MKTPNRNQVAAVVLIFGGFVFALLFIPAGLDLLRDGAFVYSPRGETPRNITVQSNPFLFYSQAAFLFSFGVSPLLCSIAGIASALFFFLKKHSYPAESMLFKASFLSAKALLYAAAISAAFIILSMVSICMRPFVS